MFDSLKFILRTLFFSKIFAIRSKSMYENSGRNSIYVTYFD